MRRRRRDKVPINAEINVVSLIDVMMLLLVIFMITAPMMQGGVDLALPEADARPLESKTSVVVSIARNGQIFIDGRTPMSYSEFKSSFRALVGRRAKDGLTLQIDEGVAWGQVARVMAVVRNEGVTAIGFQMVPEPPR